MKMLITVSHMHVTTPQQDELVTTL